MIGAGVLYWAFYTRVYNLDVCQSAMSAIASDAAVLEALGEPIQAVKWPSQEAMPNARVDESEVDVIWTRRRTEGPSQGACAFQETAGQVGNGDPGSHAARRQEKMSIRAPGDSDNEAKPWTPDANPAGKEPETKRPETKGSDLNIDLPIPPADGPPESEVGPTAQSSRTLSLGRVFRKTRASRFRMAAVMAVA